MMKMLKLTEFIHMPPGTIYKKNSSEEILIKGDWVSEDGRDWSSALFADDCGDGEHTHIGLMIGESYPIRTEQYGRDGCFDDQELFLIYEKWDLEQLKLILEKAIAQSPDQVFQKY